MDMYGFYTGQIFDAHHFLGCRMEGECAVFRTFAPAAAKIEVIGEFNDWNGTQMYRIHDRNFWECRIENGKPGMMYKYRIYLQDGSSVDHCDPYGYGMELRPASASIIRDLSSYTFQDDAWMKMRNDCKTKPLNIYEVHAGSWKKNPEDENGWYKYHELADLLIPYLKEYGYNYIEFMPLSEHPCDESWGYQNTGFFSPTSRYGTALELKEMVDKFHRNDIGVILDFVPVHFAVDGYGLANYDGTPVYEYPHQDVGNSEWGSKNFMHSRGEVRSFLQSCAAYWMEEYHVDGLRLDAISRIIYWQGDPARGMNMNAVEFLKYMNQGLKERYPGILLAAEDSTSYPGVTKAVWEGGLGFDYKWDMGWMNDTLNYFRSAPEYRTSEYHKLTFSMMYYYDANYLLPLSHDEVVHGKATIMQKMNGEYDVKFPQARAFYMYMYAHPGKKLNFMGNEFGHMREWDEKREMDWDLLKYPVHDAFHRFMKELNHLYLETPALWEKDYETEGFKWIDCQQEEKCIYAFERNGGGQKIIAVFNFSDKVQKEFAMEVPDGTWQVILNSEEECFGGTIKEKEKRIIEGDKLVMDLPAYCGIYLSCCQKKDLSLK